MASREEDLGACDYQLNKQAFVGTTTVGGAEVPTPCLCFVLFFFGGGCDAAGLAIVRVHVTLTGWLFVVVQDV